MPSTFSTTVITPYYSERQFYRIKKPSCWNFSLNFFPKLCDERYLEYGGKVGKCRNLGLEWARCYILLECARHSSRFVNHYDLQRYWNYYIINIFVSLWFPLGTLTKALFQHRKLELSTKNLDWFSLPRKQKLLWLSINFTLKTSHNCPRKMVQPPMFSR